MYTETINDDFDIISNIKYVNIAEYIKRNKKNSKVNRRYKYCV